MIGLSSLPKCSGIYRIVCKNGKSYVGSAASLYGRAHVHRHQLRKGKHHNRHLQNAWRKYGESAFTIESVECADASKLERREGFWVRFYSSNLPEYGYNIAAVCGAARGVTRTPEYLAKMSERKSKEWTVTKPNGEELTVTNLVVFSKTNGLNPSMMYRVAYGRARHWHGWKCRPVAMSKRRAESRLPPAKDTRFKPKRYVVTDPNGKTAAVMNLTQFCKARGLCTTGLCNVANGKAMQYKGWTCRKEAISADCHAEFGVGKS